MFCGRNHRVWECLARLGGDIAGWKGKVGDRIQLYTEYEILLSSRSKFASIGRVVCMWLSAYYYKNTWSLTSTT